MINLTYISFEDMLKLKYKRKKYDEAWTSPKTILDENQLDHLPITNKAARFLVKPFKRKAKINVLLTHRK